MAARVLRLIFVSLLVTQVCGCALLRRPPKAKRAIAVVPLLVGKITLVDEEGRYVLIDSGMNPSPLPGAVLKSRAAGVETGELTTGAIRRRPFAIADVIKGTPKVGDQVFQQPQ